MSRQKTHNYFFMFLFEGLLIFVRLSPPTSWHQSQNHHQHLYCFTIIYLPFFDAIVKTHLVDGSQQKLVICPSDLARCPLVKGFNSYQTRPFGLGPSYGVLNLSPQCQKKTLHKCGSLNFYSKDFSPEFFLCFVLLDRERE